MTVVLIHLIQLYGARLPSGFNLCTVDYNVIYNYIDTMYTHTHCIYIYSASDRGERNLQWRYFAERAHSHN